ncbi:MAG: FmdB family zinc ribbon protein [Chloroflexota bacterium]
METDQHEQRRGGQLPRRFVNLYWELTRMPIYEYECETCGNRFERLQSIQDDPVRQCPECSGNVHKVLHPAGIIFKGSGWYITDSRKSTSSAVTSETKTNGATSTAEAKSNGGETKTDAKPAGAATKAETQSESKAETK